jgi:hypothetical protein
LHFSGTSSTSQRGAKIEIPRINMKWVDYLKGITKETYPNVLGNSPVPNLIAGWSALVITVGLVHWANVALYPVWAFVSGALGVLLIGLFHAWYGAFGKKS